MATFPLNFMEFGQSNPCVGCPAPCCRMQLIPYRAPTTFMDMDFVYYMLLFPHTEVVVTRNGDWYVVKWENCSAFETNTFTCKLHGTPAKPRTCTMYNAYNCWYKRAFVLEDPTEVYRLDLARFEVWIKEVRFAENGHIVSAPNFERSLEILKDMPIEPRLELLTGEALAADIRLVAP